MFAILNSHSSLNTKRPFLAEPRRSANSEHDQHNFRSTVRCNTNLKYEYLKNLKDVFRKSSKLILIDGSAFSHKQTLYFS
jgi:hypothetical protein